MTVLLIAGIGVILAGLAAIGFGIPVKEFGFGNTLILTGTVGVCTGLIMISLALVARDLRKALAQAGGPQSAARLPRRELNLAPPADEAEEDEALERSAPKPPFARDAAATPDDPSAPEPNVPPWQDEVLRDRERMVAAAAGAPEEPKRRNLMFSSSRRERDKDRSEAAVAQALELDLGAPEAASAPSREPAAGNEPPRGFEDAWPASDRSRQDRPRFSDAIRQAARASATHGEQLPDLHQIPDRDEPAAPEPQRAPGVTVLKSGVVDGMAYSLYSDGSIEAQMPEGLMRFASIDELREHLDNRT